MHADHVCLVLSYGDSEGTKGIRHWQNEAHCDRYRAYDACTIIMSEEMSKR